MNSYIATDDNIIINEKYIRWVKKTNECMEICCKMEGCGLVGGFFSGTHKVCKVNSPGSYNKLNKEFKAVASKTKSTSQNKNE